MMAVWQPDDPPRRRLCPETRRIGRALGLGLPLGLAVWVVLGLVAWGIWG